MVGFYINKSVLWLSLPLVLYFIFGDGHFAKGTIQWRRIPAGVRLKPCMHVLSIEVMRF